MSPKNTKNSKGSPGTFTTPGVYIEAVNAFPNTVVPVATAIPAFIGYTAQAEYNGKPLDRTAVEINSLNDFITYFGAGPVIQFSLSASTLSIPLKQNPVHPVLALNGKVVALSILQPVFYLYNSIRLFYQNGGGTCCIVSVGSYDKPPVKLDFLDGIDVLDKEQEVTMTLFPDALSLSKEDYYSVACYAIAKAAVSQKRIAITDVWGGYAADTGEAANSVVSDFRNGIGTDNLDYCAAYYPWLETDITAATEINFLNFPDLTSYLENNTHVTQAIAQAKSAVTAEEISNAQNALLVVSPNYQIIINCALSVVNVLPPSPTIAGVYTNVDGTSGVWVAPANVALTSVIAPTVKISEAEQAAFNVDVTGKSINVIRVLAGQGVLVWGARTLAGNSNDWRYISVRRTVIFIEQSIKQAANAFVFQPNDANTWSAVKGMISNFLTQLWQQGALIGATAADTYNVSVGVGSTMSAQDILDGFMNISVQVAIVHPAEFITITIQQVMQTS